MPQQGAKRLREVDLVGAVNLRLAHAGNLVFDWILHRENVERAALEQHLYCRVEGCRLAASGGTRQKHKTVRMLQHFSQ